MNKCVWVAVVLCGLVCGCGKAKVGPPEPVYPVSGVITFKGKPVVGADVTFFNAEKKRSSFGRTNDQGEYTLTTFSANDGAVEGKATLAIMKVVAPPVSAVAEAPIESEAYQPPIPGRVEKVQKVKPEIPERYQSQQTSGLVAMISKDGPNQLNFDLE